MRYLVKTQMMHEATIWVEADNAEDAKLKAHEQDEYDDGHWYDAMVLDEEE